MLLIAKKKKKSQPDLEHTTRSLYCLIHRLAKNISVSADIEVYSSHLPLDIAALQLSAVGAKGEPSRRKPGPVSESVN